MLGELWRGYAQIGLEGTPGVGTPATRRVYLRDLVPTKERPPRPRRYATGTRDNQRAITFGPLAAGGRAVLGVSADEIDEWLAIGVRGGVASTTPAGTVRLRTYTPGDLASASLEIQDGAQAQRLVGVRANTLTLAGSVAEENLLTLDFFGTDLEDGYTMTPALAQRTPNEFDGWETTSALDAFGAVPGTTITEHMINWNVVFNNNLARKYVARNSQAAWAVTSGAMDITASVLLEASETETMDELTAWDGGTYRTLQLVFGNNDVIETTYRKFVKVSVAGAWVAVDLGQTDAGTRAYGLSLDYVYEQTQLAAGMKIEVQNARSTLWAS